jgi:enoyl-CoA hydratase/carnithine racemase
MSDTEGHFQHPRNSQNQKQIQVNMSQVQIPTFAHLLLERRNQVFIITLRRGEENRLNTTICNEVIKAFHYIQRALGPDAEGAVITCGHNAKFWCTGVDQDERDSNLFANSDGFFPMIHTILDFPYPTVALLTGHTFGGACPFALSHDYRVMNSERGFISMVCGTLILHHALC